MRQISVPCAISGLPIQVTPFPGVSSSNITHPIFTVPLKKLWPSVPFQKRLNWSPEQDGIFVLALLSETGIFHFRKALSPLSSKDIKILRDEFFRLIDFIWREEHISRKFKFPEFIFQVGGAAENSISRLPDFLYILETELDLYDRGCREEEVKRRNGDRLVRIERFLRKNVLTEKNKKAFGKLLSEWADYSCGFEELTHIQPTPFGEISLQDYWKKLIFMCCAAEQNLFLIPGVDFKELYEHLEINLNQTTMYGKELMNLFILGAQTARDYLGFANRAGFEWLEKFESRDENRIFEYIEMELGSAPKKQQKAVEVLKGILDSMDSSSMESEPNIKDYSSKFEWIKACARWNAQKGGVK